MRYYTTFFCQCINLTVANNQLSESGFNRAEIQSAISLALLFFLRMLGLFMLLPVLALYVTELEGSTPTRIGLAIGIYALTQTMFQIPMGYLSDKYGRKPIIALGLIIFVGGSALAALSNNVLFVIAGRALQGCGAISGATLALVADLTREEHRTKSMAIIGVSIGLAFSSAFVLGPLLNGYIGLSGLFWASASLGLLALAVLFILVPTPSPSEAKDGIAPEVGQTVRPGATVLGGFFLHGTLAASFVGIPLHLTHTLNLAESSHYVIYLPVILVSLLLVAPLILRAKQSSKQNSLVSITICALPAGLCLLAINANVLESPVSWLTYLGLVIFFLGFNYLEVALPSQIARTSSRGKRGQTMGRYATLQFLGIFVGALLGGFLLEHVGLTAVFLGSASLSIIWLLLNLSKTPTTN